MGASAEKKREHVSQGGVLYGRQTTTCCGLARPRSSSKEGASSSNHSEQRNPSHSADIRREDEGGQTQWFT